MVSALPLRAALKRGALIAAANWPVVLAGFVAESLYKLALLVPIVGGALMVSVLLDAEVEPIFGEGLRVAADRVIQGLSPVPVALVAFLAAVGLVAVGGLVILSMVRLATLAVLREGERRSDDLHDGPVRAARLRLATVDLDVMLAAVPRFAKRAGRLAIGLSLAYALSVGGYLLVMAAGYWLLPGSRWTAAWPILVVVATSTIVVVTVLISLTFDLVRVIVVHDDCGVRAAVHRLGGFLVVDARQVLGIYGVMAALFGVAAAGAVLATAGLALVAWFPLAGLVVAPLQAAAWLLRGLLFQGIELVALTAYLAQYRRFREPAPTAGHFRPAEIQAS